MLNIKTKLRRAFTIVELVVVIAVIAALAAILIPTFANVISSANESADQQAVKSMNTALAAAEATNGTPDSASDAMDILKEEGYNVGSYVAFSTDNTIYYDKVVNRCLIWTVATDSSSVTYPSDLAEKYAGVTGIAASWYTLSEACNTVEVYANTFSDTLTSAISSSGMTIISVNEDVKLSDDISNTDAQITLELNGNTLSIDSTDTTTSRGILSADGEEATIYISNGTVSYTGSKNKTVYMVEAKNGAAVTMENVKLTSDNQVWTGIWAGDEATQINIIDSTIDVIGTYGLQTNAENSGEHGGVTINIENSNISVTRTGGTDSQNDGDCAGILFNVEGSLNISNSNITGERQGVIARGGIITISDSTITCTGGYTGSAYYLSSAWGTGDEVPMAAITIGNRVTNSSYDYDTTVTLTGVTLLADTTSNINNQFVYMWSCDSNNVNLYYSNCNFTDDDINGKGGGTCYINGSLVS